MTTAVTVTDRSALASALRDLKLSGMLATLDARLAQARAGELGHLDFLQVLCQDEISRRQSMSLARRIRRARFETEATLEGFDFAASPKLPAAQIRDLAALRWLGRGVGHPLRPGCYPRFRLVIAAFWQVMVVAIDVAWLRRCWLSGRAPSGEFAPEVEVLAVGLFEGGVQRLGLVAVLLLEMVDLVGQGGDERVLAPGVAGSGRGGRCWARRCSMRPRRSGWP